MTGSDFKKHLLKELEDFEFAKDFLEESIAYDDPEHLLAVINMIAESISSFKRGDNKGAIFNSERFK